MWVAIMFHYSYVSREITSVKEQKKREILRSTCVLPPQWFTSDCGPSRQSGSWVGGVASQRDARELSELAGKLELYHCYCKEHHSHLASLLGVEAAAMLKVGSKFYTFDELSRRLEEFQELEQVQLWVRDSRTVVAAAKRARRKSLNPALKYAELTYSCVFGGRRPSDQTKIHNQTSAGGCPFKVRLSTSIDGQALVVKEICQEHNHEPGKKLHEEPRRLYKKTQSRTTVRKPVRYIVNKRVTSTTSKSKSRADSTESHVQLGQSPFHHLNLHQQQYQQQQQLKLQLQQHLQQQQEQQQQIRQRQVEVIQLDSPDHIDTPDHLSSPDLSTSFDQLGSLNNSVDQYTYLPPSPISPSLSSGCPVDCEEEEECLEPILDLEEALEEALGELDSVGSMEIDTSLRLTTAGSTTPTPAGSSQAEVSVSADDYTGPPPAKRQRGRPRKQSFTGSMFDNSVDIPDLDFSLSDLMDFDVYLF